MGGSRGGGVGEGWGLGGDSKVATLSPSNAAERPRATPLTQVGKRHVLLANLGNFCDVHPLKVLATQTVFWPTKQPQQQVRERLTHRRPKSRCSKRQKSKTKQTKQNTNETESTGMLRWLRPDRKTQRKRRVFHPSLGSVLLPKRDYHVFSDRKAGE